MNNKKCSICNYDLYVEKHHPDGKKDIYYIKDWKEEKEYKYNKDEYNKFIEHIERLETIDVVNNSYSFSSCLKFEHINPDNWMYLCGNCHNLYHKCGYSLEKIKEIHNNIDKFHNDLYNYMMNEIGIVKVNKYKDWLIHIRQRDTIANERIGKLCSCGKKHYKQNVIISCMVREGKIRKVEVI